MRTKDVLREISSPIVVCFVCWSKSVVELHLNAVYEIWYDGVGMKYMR